MTQPPEYDSPQPIKAGAMRGLLWVLEKMALESGGHLLHRPGVDGKDAPFSRARHTISIEQAQTIMLGVSHDGDRGYAAAFDAELAVLSDTMIPILAKSAKPSSEPTARTTLDAYRPLFSAVRDAGPPDCSHVENGWCDGTKLTQGIPTPNTTLEAIQRKGRLLGEGRLVLGTLPLPRLAPADASADSGVPHGILIVTTRKEGAMRRVGSSWTPVDAMHLVA